MVRSTTALVPGLREELGSTLGHSGCHLERPECPLSTWERSQKTMLDTSHLGQFRTSGLSFRQPRLAEAVEVMLQILDPVVVTALSVQR